MTNYFLRDPSVRAFQFPSPACRPPSVIKIKQSEMCRKTQEAALLLAKNQEGTVKGRGIGDTAAISCGAVSTCGYR